MAIELPKITFLLMNAFTVGGTIRTTFTMAGELARRGHEVEIVSVYRMRQSAPQLPVPEGVRLRTLTDLRAPTLERYAAGRDPVSRLRHWLVSRPSRLISSNDWRYDNFSLLTDVALLRFLASVRDGILIGTRPALNVLIARLASRQVVRVGQDHVNLSSYLPALRAEMKAAYPRLDLVTALTPDRYRRMLKDRGPVECFPNAVPDVDGHRADPDAKAKLPGFTRRLHEEFSCASVYVLSSRQEGFPMALIEAMSGLMTEPDKRRAFGQAALSVVERYDAGAIAERWERRLGELVANKGPERETIAGRTLEEASRRLRLLARRRLRR